jgi:uncharacterized membrane protein
MSAPRPKGITLLAILLVGVALGGAVVTVLFAWYFDVDVQRPVLLAISIPYSACALASAHYLWRMQRKGVKYFYAWGALAVALAVLMTSESERPSWQVPLIALVTAVTVLALGEYARGSLTRFGR